MYSSECLRLGPTVWEDSIFKTLYPLALMSDADPSAVSDGEAQHPYLNADINHFTITGMIV